jgi:positive regulator of sigma E activity
MDDRNVQQLPVRLSIPVSLLIKIVAGLYGVPLVGILIGALAAGAAGAGDFGALLGSVAGGALGCVWIRRNAVDLERLAVSQLQFHSARSEVTGK